MMLLTAFVLVLGFVALTGMVARVAQLPEHTRQATDRPIYTESAAVAKGINTMLQRIDALNAVDEDTMAGYADAYLVAATDATAHMERLESARGFRLRFADPPIVCQDIDLGGDGFGPRAVFVARFSLNDLDTRVQFTTRYALEPAADASTDDPDMLPTVHNCP